MIHLSTSSLILAGVVLHLLLGLSRALFTRPKQQAQIAVLDAKVSAVLNQVQQIAPVVAAVFPKSAPAAAQAAEVANALGLGLNANSLGLNPLPAPGAAPTSVSAQGGAS